MIDKLARAQARIVAINADIADPDELRDAQEFRAGTGDAIDAKFAAIITNQQVREGDSRCGAWCGCEAANQQIMEDTK